MRHKKINKIITVASITLAGVLGFFAIKNIFLTAEAEDTLSGIQSLVQDIQVREKPYTILEVVPDAKNAEIGFYVEGNEPILSQRQEDGTYISWQERLGECETEQERAMFVSELADQLQAFYTLRYPNASISSAADEVPVSYTTYSELDGAVEGASVLELEEREKKGFFQYTEDTTKVLYQIEFAYATHKGDNLQLDNPKMQYYYPKATLITSTSQLDDDTIVYTLENEGVSNQERFLPSGEWGTIKEDLELNDSVSGGDSVSGNVITGDSVSGNDDTVSGSDLGKEYYTVSFEPWSKSVVTPYHSLYIPGKITADPNGEYCFMEGMGNFTVKFPAETIYYTGGFTNNNWFARKVLNLDEDQVDEIDIKVVTMTARELAAGDGIASTDGSNDYDLLYLASGYQLNTVDKESKYNDEILVVDDAGLPIIGSDGTALVETNDISVAMRDYLFEYTMVNELPCIVDASIVFTPDGSGVKNMTQFKEDGSYTNIFMLALQFMQPSPKALYDKMVNGDGELPTMDEMLANIVDQDKNYVADHVYAFYNPYTLVGPNFFTEKYFVKEKPQGAKADGFDAVMNEIITENTNREADTSEEYNPLPTDVTQADIVRHIVNYKNRRQELRKDSLYVLDIMPVKIPEDQNPLTETAVRIWAGQTEGASAEELNVVIDHMTTSEFIGKIDDINEKYDLIYINGFVGDTANLTQDGEMTVFNDSSMNGLVYYHTGDIRVVNEELAGQLASERKDDGTVYSKNIVRYSGNDITVHKAKELLSFLEASYPIVVDVNLVSGNDKDKEINTIAVDETSYLYDFLEEAIKRPNLYVEQELASSHTKSMFEFYLNRPKVRLEKKHFAEDIWASGHEGVYELKQGLDGNYKLNYKFTIVNEGAASINTRYRCQLFADADADGRFSTMEELRDISITHNGNAVLSNELLAGREYVMTRIVADEYAGLLPWKVQITQANNPSIRTGWIGYTKLEGLERERVEILQITRNPKTGEEMFNLEERLDDPTDIYNKLVYGSFEGAERLEYPGIYDDFDVSVDTMSLNEFIDIYVNENADILNEYNMLILGFAEGFDDIDNAMLQRTTNVGPLDAIRNYVASGKSVLFTNDVVSYVNFKPGTKKTGRTGNEPTTVIKTEYNPYNMTRTFRDMVGMNRYGKGKDVAYLPGDEKHIDTGLTQGYTYSIINAKVQQQASVAPAELGVGQGTRAVVNEFENLNFGEVYVDDTKTLTSDGWYNDNTVSNLQVTKVNSGQITEYPYKLEDTLNVSNTHAQYYQLDLVTDADHDEQSDVVVWYCLGGRDSNDKSETIYSKSPNDVMNNYYIYNKGNITYTSMGYAGDQTTEDEAKLFVNTMIAAFRAGVKNPTVSVMSDGTRDAVEITSVNRYHDDNAFTADEGYASGKDLSELGNPNDGNRNDLYEILYFRVNDPNFIKGDRNICLRLYEDIYVNNPADAPSDAKSDFTYAGKKIYYRPLTGEGTTEQISIYKAGGSTPVDANDLVSGVTYCIKIPKDKVTNAKKRYSIYFEVWSRMTNHDQEIETPKGYQRFDYTKVQLFDLE